MPSTNTPPSAGNAPIPIYPKVIQVAALVGIILVSFNLRAAVTSLSAIYTFIGHDIANLNISALGTLPVIAFAIFGSLTPVLVHRIGFERSLILSMVLLALGIFCRAHTSSFPAFAGWSIVALAGIAFSNVLMLPIIKKYNSTHVGAVTAIYSIMIAISAAVPSAVAVPIVDALGWRANVELWAIPAAISIVPWIYIAWHMRTKLAHITHPTAAQLDLHKLGQDRKHIAPYRWPVAWSIVILFGVGMMSMYAMLTWLPTFLVSQGLSRSTAGNVLFIYNIIGIPHSLLVPMYLGKMKRPFLVVIAATVLQIAGYMGFLFNSSNAYLWAVIAGPGLMTIPASFALINLRTRTSEGSSSLSSFVQGIGYVFAALGPFLFGKLHSITASWSMPFIFLSVMAVIMLVGGMLAVQNRYLEDM